MSETGELAVIDVIEIGRKLSVLKNPGIYTGDQYREAITAFEELTAKCGFFATHELAEVLRTCTFYVDPATQRATRDSKIVFDWHAEAIHKMLIAEGNKKTAYLTEIEAPEAINELESRLGRPLEPNQAAMRLDTIKCLRTHLNRPAIVTAWALGFHIVRWWVFCDAQRLLAFNKQYSKNLRPSEPPSIAEYSDMLHIGEYRFIQICRDSQDSTLLCFTDNEFRDLQALLDQRNEFAHANFNLASNSEAAAYVERVVRVVTKRPFGQ